MGDWALTLVLGLEVAGSLLLHGDEAAADVWVSECHTRRGRIGATSQMRTAVRHVRPDVSQPRRGYADGLWCAGQRMGGPLACGVCLDQQLDVVLPIGAHVLLQHPQLVVELVQGRPQLRHLTPAPLCQELVPAGKAGTFPQQQCAAQCFCSGVMEILNSCHGHLVRTMVIIIIIIIEGLSLLQSIPPTTADKQTQAQRTMVLLKFTEIQGGRQKTWGIYSILGRLYFYI